MLLREINELTTAISVMRIVAADIPLPWTLWSTVFLPAMLLLTDCAVKVEGKMQLKAELDAPSVFCNELISKFGYPCEERQVITDDGYILAVQRIPHGIQQTLTSTRQPVFLLHGLLQGGEAWVLNSPEQSLGFILANVGYDVWIGNLRGTRWSSKHMSFTNEEKGYWNWSWDEHVAFDLPTMLKLVYETTGSSAKYIGYSQGTIIFLAALSQSWVTQYVDQAVLLSPIAYLNHVTSILINTAAKTSFDQIILDAGVVELDVTSGPVVELIKKLCAMMVSNCANLMIDLTGPNCCINNSRMSYYENYEPQSTSTKNIAHLAQMVRSGKFCKYDHGAKENFIQYGQVDPPIYALSKAPKDFPLLLAYGGNDALADSIDVQHLISELPCNYQRLYLPKYAHMDFPLSTSTNNDIFEPIASFFSKN
ncbi:hypothetical protein O6H91_03G018900 [Diphasiastrum complanatum]|uniref:Uncharacterized protein n=1 Tax=Diphasiastrum complanatum TaxID=34168 RepID=A0ACC2E3X2_DIPCM|nr:hypothetical protein O6H91_03G018900 [Diphasiastrum complanatum]